MLFSYAKSLYFDSLNLCKFCTDFPNILEDFCIVFKDFFNRFKIENLLINKRTIYNTYSIYM